MIISKPRAGAESAPFCLVFGKDDILKRAEYDANREDPWDGIKLTARRADEQKAARGRKCRAPLS